MNHLIEIKIKFPELTLEIYVQFLNTHWYDLTTNEDIDIFTSNIEDIDIVDEFFEWAYFNNIIEEIVA